MYGDKVGKIIRVLLLICLFGVSTSRVIKVWAEQLPIRTYTVADGLARDQVNRIVQDSQGFLWFCTSEGLSRFDGYKFTSYTTSNGLPHNRVSDLLETRDGRYLVATADGLCQFNPRGGSLFTCCHPPESEAHEINELLEDHLGAIWCGTNAGLYRLEETGGQYTFHFVDLALPMENHDTWSIEALIEDSSGALWVGTRGSGLFRCRRDVPAERFTTAQGLPSDRITSLLEDRQGTLWVGTSFGLCWLVSGRDSDRQPVVGRRYSVADGLADNWITTLLQTADGRLLVGSRGLSEMVATADPSHPRFRRYMAAEAVGGNGLETMAEDRDGNLWLGTSNSGALKIARNGFHTWGRSDGLGNGEIASVFGDLRGELCCFLRDRQNHEFISRLEGQKFTTVRLDLSAATRNLGWGWGQMALQGRAGEWWAPTGQGLYRFPPVDRFTQLARARAKTIYTTNNGLVTDEAFRLFEDSRGDLWIGSISPTLNGLMRWDRSREAMRTYTEADGLPARNVLPTAFGEDRANHVWIGFSLGSLARYSGGRFDVFTSTDGAPPGWIRAIYSDRAGRLWVSGGQVGVSRIDDPEAARPSFVTYTVAEGLSSNQVDCITEDQWGRLYFGTGRGLDRLDPATGHIKHYTTADGLCSGRVRFAFRDHAGALWFGNESELSRLIPEPDRAQSAPSILIQGLRIAGVISPISELGEAEVAPLELAAGQSQVSIDFVGVEFDPGEVLRYQYKLEGADRDWNTPTEERTVNYANLAPGNYRFLVRAVTGEGVMSSQPASFTFGIPTPLWRQWWFVTTGLVVLGLLAHAAHRYRVGRLIELERVRTRIATDLHDDIGSSLSRMAILSEVAKRRMEAAERDSASILTEIAESARGAVDSMNDIVWAIDPRRDDLSNVIFRVRQFASDLLGAKGIAWSLEAAAEFDKIKLNPQQRRHIFLIFKEAINNSARHAACKSVGMSLAISHDRIIGEIRDDGRGLAIASVGQCTDDGRGGHGLENMRTRAVQLGGHLIIDSTPGRGTCVRVEVPLKRTIA